MFSTLQHQTLTHSRRSEAQSVIVPKITPTTIKRAQQGVAYARDTKTQETIQKALKSAEEVAEGGSENKMSAQVRRCFLRMVMHTLFRVKVEFPERVPTTPSVVVANHLNHIDPFLVLSQLPANLFYNVMGDARTMYHTWWKRQFLRFAKGVIPLERLWKEEVAVMEAAKAGREDLADLAAAIEEYVPSGNTIEAMRRLDRIVKAIFARGEGLMLFPEGKLGKVEGQLLPLKRGAILYALRSGVPIVPVALIGTHNLFFRKELIVRFGEPLYFPQSSRPKQQEIQAATEKLQAAMQALLPTDYQEPKGMNWGRKFLNNVFC
jgi:1-acyl-sn-glycerol-3-phosphate acyltransferase